MQTIQRAQEAVRLLTVTTFFKQTRGKQTTNHLLAPVNSMSQKHSWPLRKYWPPNMLPSIHTRYVFTGSHLLRLASILLSYKCLYVYSCASGIHLFLPIPFSHARLFHTDVEDPHPGHQACIFLCPLRQLPSPLLHVTADCL